MIIIYHLIEYYIIRSRYHSKNFFFVNKFFFYSICCNKNKNNKIKWWYIAKVNKNNSKINKIKTNNTILFIEISHLNFLLTSI